MLITSISVSDCIWFAKILRYIAFGTTVTRLTIGSHYLDHGVLIMDRCWSGDHIIMQFGVFGLFFHSRSLRYALHCVPSGYCYYHYDYCTNGFSDSGLATTKQRGMFPSRQNCTNTQMPNKFNPVEDNRHYTNHNNLSKLVLNDMIRRNAGVNHQYKKQHYQKYSSSIVQKHEKIIAYWHAPHNK